MLKKVPTREGVLGIPTDCQSGHVTCQCHNRGFMIKWHPFFRAIKQLDIERPIDNQRITRHFCRNLVPPGNFFKTLLDVMKTPACRTSRESMGYKIPHTTLP